MAAVAKFGGLKIKKQLKQSVRNNVRFSRRSAKLSYIYNRVNRMNELIFYRRLPTAGRRHIRLVAVTYYNAAVMIENHLCFVIGRHIACRPLEDVY